MCTNIIKEFYYAYKVNVLYALISNPKTIRNKEDYERYFKKYRSLKSKVKSNFFGIQDALSEMEKYFKDIKSWINYRF